jgi:hypothetical protein
MTAYGTLPTWQGAKARAAFNPEADMEQPNANWSEFAT